MNFGGMPRGGGRKVTHNTQICSICVFVFDATLLFVAAVPCRNEKRNPIHLFFSCFFRARVLSEESISSFSEMIIPLSFCVLRSIREGDRVFQNARSS